MKRHHPVTANEPVEFAHHLPVTFCRPEIVTSRKHVAGVHANGKAGWMVGRLDDGGQMLEPVTEIRPLPRRRLQRNFDRAARRRAKHFVQIPGDAAQTGLFAGTHVRAGVHDDKRYAKSVGTPHFVHHRREGTPGIRCREVDEVGTVGEDRNRPLGAKPLHLVDGVRLTGPLHLVFQKDLDGLAAGGRAAFERAIHAAGNAHVGAELGHGLIFGASLTKSNRMKKLLRRILLVLVVLVAGLYFARNFIARKAVEIGTTKVTGFPLTIGRVKIGLFTGTLEVSGLKLLNPPEFKESRFVDLPLLKVDYDMLSMLRGAPHLREVVINVQEVVLVKNEQGASNATRLQVNLAPAGGEAKPAKTTPYRVDLLKLHIGTVIIKDYSKTQPTEKKLTLNQDIVFQNITESVSISSLVMRTVFGQVGDVAGELTKGVNTIKGATGEFQQTGQGLFDDLKKAVPTK